MAEMGSLNIASEVHCDTTGTGDVESVTATVPAVVNNADPANPVINVASAAPPAIGPSTVGTSNDLARGNHTHTTLEVANIAALAAVASATINDGAFAYVDTLKSWFKLEASTLTADNIAVVAASGKAASRWLRVLERNLTWEARTTWEVDPVNGSDEATGATATLSVKTMAELSRRLWDCEIATGVTITIRGNVPAADSNAFNCKFRIGAQITIIGTLGATTGGGGAAVDNTLYTGTVSNYVAGSATPAADDIELTDSTIPVSFTASGLLARGVIFRRTVTATRHWYAVKDLGAKTIRITCPMNNVGPANFSSNALANGNAYSAFAMWTMPPQVFGFADALSIRFDTLHAIQSPASNPDEEGGPRGYAPLRSRIYIGLHTAAPFLSLGLALTNCCFNTGSDTGLSFATQLPPNIIGGGFIGTGATKYVFWGTGGIGGATVFQGCRLELNDRSYFTVESAIAVHDVAVSPAINCVGDGKLAFMQVGLSGKGNTGKLVQVNWGGSLYYGQSATLPPFVAASTTDATPITIGATSYTVANVPALADTLLSPVKQFPYAPTAVANGAVALALGATGPAGLPANPVRYVQVPDGVGGVFTFPSWT